jgi:hypothetical protein
MPEKRPDEGDDAVGQTAPKRSKKFKKSTLALLPHAAPPPPHPHSTSPQRGHHPSGTSSPWDDIVSELGDGWHLRGCNQCACQRHVGHGICGTCGHADVCHRPHRHPSPGSEIGLASAARLLLQSRVALVKLTACAWSEAFLEAAWALIEGSGSGGGGGGGGGSKRKGKKNKNKRNRRGSTEHLVELRRSCSLALRRLAQSSLRGNDGDDSDDEDVDSCHSSGNRWLLLRAVAAIDDFYYRIYYDDLTARAARAGAASSESQVSGILTFTCIARTHAHTQTHTHTHTPTHTHTHQKIFARRTTFL